jgi:hypothetical protein
MTRGNFTPRARRRTVEECYSIDADRLRKAGAFNLAAVTRGEFFLAGSTATFAAALHDDAPWALEVTYRVAGKPVACTIPLSLGSPRYGGWRVYFLCPGCGGRYLKLYLPPGCQRLACRRCHDLAYSSQQKTHAPNRLDVLIAARVGITPREARRLIEKGL